MSAVKSDASLATAEEILNYAEEKFEKAVKSNDILLYRNTSDKAFLSLVVAVNSYINRKLGIIPRSHSERRTLRKMNREDLKVLYSDVMRTLHDEASCEGIYNPKEARYAMRQIRKILESFKKG